MTDAPNELRGASGWEQNLYAHLTEHVRNERGLLEEYDAAADATSSKAFAYLVGLLIEDERRHHVLFEELAASLKNEAELSGQDPVVPRMDFDRVDPANVRGLTDRLAEREQQDLRELKKLQKELRERQGHDALVVARRSHAAGYRQAHRHPPLRPRTHLGARLASGDKRDLFTDTEPL